MLEDVKKMRHYIDEVLAQQFGDQRVNEDSWAAMESLLGDSKVTKTPFVSVDPAGHVLLTWEMFDLERNDYMKESVNFTVKFAEDGRVFVEKWSDDFGRYWRETPSEDVLDFMSSNLPTQ